MSNTSDLRAGMRVSWASVAWTFIASTAAIVVGLADDSLVLVVFGLTGLLDAVGSVILALHFRHALRHEVISATRERLALYVISGGLIVIGISTVVESVRRLLDDATAQGSPFGTALASVSVVVLAILALRKHQLARRLENDALRADGWLSATGAGLAVITVVGTALVASSGPSWIDPVAALVVAVLATGVGLELLILRRERS